MNLRLSIYIIFFSFLLGSCSKKEKHWAYQVNDIPIGFEFEKSDSIVIPEAIYSAFEMQLDSVYRDSSFFEELGLSRENSVSKIFYTIPINANTLIYVVHFTDEPVHTKCLSAFFAYDLKTKIYSEKPFWLNAYFSNEMGFEFPYRMMSPPYFRFEKDRKVFVVKERHHNGNIYNTINEHWVKIDNNMNLIPLFSIETIAFVPFDETKNKINRQLDDHLQLHVTLMDSTNNIISDIGKATLFKKENDVFEWRDIQIVDTLYRKLFFSCKSDN